MRIRGTLVCNVKNMDWAGVWGVRWEGRQGCWMEEDCQLGQAFACEMLFGVIMKKPPFSQGRQEDNK